MRFTIAREIQGSVLCDAHLRAAIAENLLARSTPSTWR
jgi:hypothetical protein